MPSSIIAHTDVYDGSSGRSTLYTYANLRINCAEGLPPAPGQAPPTPAPSVVHLGEDGHVLGVAHLTPTLTLTPTLALALTPTRSRTLEKMGTYSG